MVEPIKRGPGRPRKEPPVAVEAQVNYPPKLRKRARQMIAGSAPYVAPKGVVHDLPTFGHRPRHPAVRLTLQPNRT